MEPYFNASYGNAFNGVFNYTNTLVEGWLVNLFLFFIYIVMMYVGSKGEWKMAGVSAIASLLCLITAMGLSTITEVSKLTIYLPAIILAISVTLQYAGNRN